MDHKNHTKHHSHSHPPTANMLTVEDALARILNLVYVLEETSEELLNSDNLVLAQDIFSSLNIPSLANSAMDGYAVRAIDTKTATADSPVTLNVLGQVQAGALPSLSVFSEAAIRIMTGAPIPEGADSIIPYELTDERNRLENNTGLDRIQIHSPATLGDHVRPPGEDTSIGELALESGYELNPAGIGLLAALGLQHVPVIRRPTVAILATGNEGDIRQKILASLSSDLLITSAGVSGGAYDLVKDVLSELGTVDFWSVKMRPAKPIAFGILKNGDRNIPHIGLPGNPVSALVALIEFARPAIMKMMGKNARALPTIEAILDDDIENTDGRRVYARVQLYKQNDKVHAHLTGSQGSNLLTSMTLANGLAICPENYSKLAKGDQVVVQLLDWLDHYDILTKPHDISIALR